MIHLRVVIIILNWNGWSDTIECLESLYQITYPNYDVIVVDNGSKDRSVEKIKEYAEGKIQVKSKFFKFNPDNKPINILEYTREEIEKNFSKKNKFENINSNKKLILIKNEKNYGFAEGNNIAIRYAMKDLNPDYICLLNNDTNVDKMWLIELVQAMEHNDNVGFCSSKLLFYDNEQMINSTGILILRDGAAINRGRNEQDKGQYDTQRDTFGACAAASLYSIVSLREVGLFDPDYFAYYEDVDLSWRLQLAGWKCLYVPTAIAYHKYSKSGGAFSLFKVYQGERNRVWNVIKNFPITYFLFSFPYNILKIIIMFYANITGRGRGTWYSKRHSLFLISLTMWKANFDAWKEIRKFLKKRKEIKKIIKINKKDIRGWFVKYSPPIGKIPYL